jgi:hypothetical protein
MEQGTAVLSGMLEEVHEARESQHRVDVWLSLSQIAFREDLAERRPTAHPDPFIVPESTASVTRWVLWESEVPFTVLFTPRSPIVGPPSVHAVFDDITGRWAAAAKILPYSASSKPYKYTLAMLAEGDQILVADPGGVVTRDPGG